MLSVSGQLSNDNYLTGMGDQIIGCSLTHYNFYLGTGKLILSVITDKGHTDLSIREKGKITKLSFLT